MQTKELKRLGITEADRLMLAAVSAEIDAAVPAAKAGRDILEHFDDYARGEGRLAKEAVRDLGLDVPEPAAMVPGV